MRNQAREREVSVKHTDSANTLGLLEEVAQADHQA